MHIELTEENADKIRQLSNALDLPSARIVNILLNELNHEILDEEIVMIMKREKIEMLRSHLKLMREVYLPDFYIKKLFKSSLAIHTLEV